ncbi:MAG: sulfotransferase [Planctomycetota bacterium]
MSRSESTPWRRVVANGIRAPFRMVRGERSLYDSARFAPIFIVGSGRCGSTLLRRMLQHSGALHIPPENSALPAMIRMYRQYRDRSWTALVHMTMDHLEAHPDFAVFDLKLDEVRTSLRKVAVNRQSLATIVDAVYTAHSLAHGNGAARWADKTPLNVYHMQDIRQVFPDARFIVLVRDGVDVVRSMMEKGGRERTMTAAMDRWQTSIHAAEAFQHAHPGTCLEIRYESLVSDAPDALHSICAFIEIDYDATMLDSTDTAASMQDVGALAHHAEVARPVSAAHIGKGRRDLEPGQLQTIERILGDDLVRLGYPPAWESSA